MRNNIHPAVSKAEYQVFAELSRKELTEGMVTQKPIILKATVPDFMWIAKKKAVYLDGDKVHKEGDEWDEEVIMLLEKIGWQAIRIPYHAPLTKQALEKIMEQIEAFLHV